MAQADDESRSFPEANVAAARSLAGALVTTLGPVPRDKMLVGADDGPDMSQAPGGEESETVVVTSDGATILESLALDHPIAPIVRRLAGPERPGDTDIEGQDIPDGVTTTLVLTAALLDEAMSLVDRGIHPTSIRQGFDAGLDVATETLERIAEPAEEALAAVARTAMTGNDIGGRKDEWARLAVDAVEAVGYPKPETFAVRSVGRGSLTDSRLVRGTVLDRNEITDRAMPRRASDASVLVLDGQDEGGLRTLELDGRYSATVDDPETLRRFQDTDAERRAGIVEQLVTHDVDVVVARQGIESEYAQLLADNGIIGIDGVTRLYLGQVCNATGAVPLKRTEEFEPSVLGTAGVVEEIRGDPRGPDRPDRQLVVFDDCPETAAVCALLYGAWGPLSTGATTALRKAAAAVATAQGYDGHRAGVVPGGGAAETRVAAAARERATRLDGREQLVVEAFADAVETVVFSLVKNGGLDPLTVRPDLRAANANRESARGVSLPDGAIVDAADAGILDPLATRRQCYVSAVEVASLLVGIDDAVSASFSEPEPDPDDTIYEDAADQQQSYLSKHDDTRFDR
jgi:chaperonin GroEL (HSP60 family)